MYVYVEYYPAMKKNKQVSRNNLNESKDILLNKRNQAQDIIFV